MSKQSEAKQEQGYRTVPKNCGNCKHRFCEVFLQPWMERANAGRKALYTLEQHGAERKQACGLGGFAVKKTATCDKWESAA